MTTVNVPPADIHEIGLKEVARITDEMTKLAESQGYKDLASFREAVNNDPKWKPTSEQQILDDYKKYIHQMEPKLPELFGLLPKSPVTVEPIPDFAKAAATHYVLGTPDGKRPGRVVVAVSNPTKRTLVDDEAIALMNDSPYGLTASLWTRHRDAAERIGMQIETGTVFMNRCDYLDPGLAWTGVKNSGRGVTLSVLGYEHLTRPKSFHLRVRTP